MKESNLTFAQGFSRNEWNEANKQGKTQKAFDWDKAAVLIKNAYQQHKDLVAEAGLEGDWDYTGGIIFENGKPTNDSYTYLESNWATPSIGLSWDGKEQQSIPCFTDADERFNSGAKWDKKSLSKLKIQLPK